MGISDVPKISDKKIREISEISAFTKLNSRMIKFMNWVADYNLIDRGYILKMILAQEKVYFSKRDTKNNTDKKYATMESAMVVSYANVSGSGSNVNGSDHVSSSSL